MQLKTNRNLRIHYVNCCSITLNTKKDNSNQHPISNNIKQKRNFFHRHLDWLHSILKKMHRKFEGNRPISKKVIAFQRMNWNAKPNLPSSQAGRKTSAYNCQQFQDHHLDLLSCFQLFEVFEVFDPLLSPIAPYPYLFTQWPHRLVCSTHVNTIFSTVASIR